jgi:hypothetical protein
MGFDGMSGAQQAVCTATPHQEAESSQVELTEAERADVESLDNASKTIYFKNRKEGSSHAIAMQRPFQAWC